MTDSTSQLAIAATPVESHDDQHSWQDRHCLVGWRLSRDVVPSWLALADPGRRIARTGRAGTRAYPAGRLPRAPWRWRGRASTGTTMDSRSATWSPSRSFPGPQGDRHSLGDHRCIRGCRDPGCARATIQILFCERRSRTCRLSRFVFNATNLLAASCSAARNPILPNGRSAAGWSQRRDCRRWWRHRRRSRRFCRR